jgi:hypothetical protein
VDFDFEVRRSTMANPEPFPYFGFVAPFLLVGFVSAISMFLSLVGGWHRLGQMFRASERPAGRRFRMESGSVGWVSYNHCLTVSNSADGLYLSVMLPFRLGHPPLLIPWEEIHYMRTRRFLWMEDIVFEVGSPRIAKLCLPKRVFEGRELVA